MQEDDPDTQRSKREKSVKWWRGRVKKEKIKERKQNCIRELHKARSSREQPGAPGRESSLKSRFTLNPGVDKKPDGRVLMPQRPGSEKV